MILGVQSAPGVGNFYSNCKNDPVSRSQMNTLDNFNRLAFWYFSLQLDLDLTRMKKIYPVVFKASFNTLYIAHYKYVNISSFVVLDIK